ncbi:unnamed protein product [Didymodactylos carnosus]|uniref:Uncharacterized protein n=2 Tax=Didymodactylos carnosus TaxID=1234261 RepID=A0A8S2EXW6_9BILA|nr:unnamed protein product [Didymodactylos carnosus]CAF4075161.1 unnamed protein product [Didymodactylos carnosus]
MVRDKIRINTKNERRKLILKKKPQINNDLLTTKQNEFETKIDQMIKTQINIKEMNIDEINETLTKIIVDTAGKLAKEPNSNSQNFWDNLLEICE